MTVKKHYDNHLGNFYSWMIGDFETKKEDFKQFCLENKIQPSQSGYAVDLGAGNGIQSIALAELGYQVIAIDFNPQLLEELKLKSDNTIEIINDNIQDFSKHLNKQPELIICCGDTISHLESFDEIKHLIQSCFNNLSIKGKLILTFRDYSNSLEDMNRFVPVKSDSDRILTCFLEYFQDKVRVTDLLYELQDNLWIQKVSSYYKGRISRNIIIEFLNQSGFKIIFDKEINRMITIIAEKA